MAITLAKYGENRLNRVLNENKKGNPEELRRVLSSDIKKILNDFVVMDSSPTVDIMECGDEFEIKITAKAERIKPFGVLPKDYRY